MKIKAITTVMLTLFLVSVFISTFSIQLVKAETVVPTSVAIVETTRITKDELLDRTPCLIQDIGGRFLSFYCSYDVSTNVYNIRMSYSSDGMVWSTPRQITTETDPLYGCLSPSAIQDQDGIYWLTWHRDLSGIWIASSSNGIDWDTPQQITYYDSVKLSWCRSPSLIQDQNGFYWLAYESEIHMPDILIRNSDDGVDWNPPIYVTPAHDSYFDGSPSLIQDSNGKYWMTWYRLGGTIWISSSNDGLSWATPTQMLTGMYSLFPSIIQDSSGKYILTWIDTDTSNGNIWISSSDDCINWEVPQQLTSDYKNTYPSLTQDIYGSYRVVYTSYVLGDDDIWMMTLGRPIDLLLEDLKDEIDELTREDFKWRYRKRWRYLKRALSWKVERVIRLVKRGNYRYALWKLRHIKYSIKRRLIEETAVELIGKVDTIIGILKSL